MSSERPDSGKRPGKKNYHLIFQGDCATFQPMITNDLLADSQQYHMNTYSRQPLVLVKGRGMKVTDSDGREYLDFVAGVAVNNLGHCHPRVVVALQKQAQRLMHVSNRSEERRVGKECRSRW